MNCEKSEKSEFFLFVFHQFLVDYLNLSKNAEAFKYDFLQTGWEGGGMAVEYTALC